jgi:hypothetical protein
LEQALLPVALLRRARVLPPEALVSLAARLLAPHAVAARS